MSPKRLPAARELRYLAEMTRAYLLGLEDVLGVLRGCGPAVEIRYTQLLDHLEVTTRQGSYVGTVRAISEELTRLLQDDPRDLRRGEPR